MTKITQAKTITLPDTQENRAHKIMGGMKFLKKHFPGLEALSGGTDGVQTD